MKKLYTLLSLILALSGVVGAAELPANSEAPFARTLADLRASDEGVRAFAKQRLLQPEHAKRLQAIAPQLIAALGDFEQSEESARILGLLSLPDALKEKLSFSARTPRVVKARLGDRAAEAAVIKAFKDARHPLDRREQCLDLLYLESTNALRAFFESFASQELSEDVFGNRVSTVAVLIRCYGQYHPEEPLFSVEECLKHANVAPETFATQPHQDYLRQVEAHFEKQLGIHLHINPPILLETYKIEALQEFPK